LRFVHSSDLHLKEGKGKRFEALRSILSLAQQEGVQYVIFAGDFFDKGIDARMLRGSLRNLFSEFQNIITIIVPGNHDEVAYPAGTYLGDNVRILSKKPFEYVETEDAVFVGIPYPSEEDITPQFFDVLDDIDLITEKPAIAIVHGTLIGGECGFAGRFGEEEGYNPIHLQDLQEAKFKYYALGHIHQPYEKLIKIQGKILAGYPGSPVSVTKAETGKRGVIVGRLDGDNPLFDVKELDSFYTISESLTVIPHREKEILKELEKIVGEKKDPNSELHLTISGFVGWKEGIFLEKVSKVLRGVSDNIILEPSSLQNISEINSVLIETFLKELNRQELEEATRRKCEETFFKSILAVEG
jgi:DNA repair exonuclease SbcCD nuclease subunit